MKIAILGSGALAALSKGHREPRDIDVLGSYDDVVEYFRGMGTIEKMYPSSGGNKQIARIDGSMFEGEIVWENSLSEKLLYLIENDSKTTVKNGLLVPSINVLYMLKMSHRYLKNAPSFRKTMLGIQHLRSIGAFIEDDHKKFLKLREAETYSYSHPKLNVGKKDFFTDSVKYVYEHDDIHKVVKTFEKPAYEYFKSEHSEVLCDKNLFFGLDEKYRLAAVAEESMVLAIERSLVPHPGTFTPKQAYLKALEKVCTSITSGWFREFAWETYDTIASMFDETYFEKFKLAVSNNEVRLFNNESI